MFSEWHQSHPDGDDSDKQLESNICDRGLHSHASLFDCPDPQILKPKKHIRTLIRFHFIMFCYQSGFVV